MLYKHDSDSFAFAGEGLLMKSNGIPQSASVVSGIQHLHKGHVLCTDALSS